MPKKNSLVKVADGPGYHVEMIADKVKVIDSTDMKLDQIASGYVLGSESWKKRSDVKKKLEDRVVKKIGAKGKLITDSLFELIAGVYTEEPNKNKEGMRKIYQSPPSLGAIKLALETVLGRPTQKTEHTDEKHGILTVEHIIKSFAEERGGVVKDGDNVIPSKNEEVLEMQTGEKS